MHARAAHPPRLTPHSDRTTTDASAIANKRVTSPTYSMIEHAYVTHDNPRGPQPSQPSHTKPAPQPALPTHGPGRGLARPVPCNIATGVNTCVNAKLMLQCVAMIATHCNGALVAMVPFLDAFATLQSVAIPCLDVSCNVAIGGEGPDSGVNGWRCNVAVGELQCCTLGNCNIVMERRANHVKPHIVKY